METHHLSYVKYVNWFITLFVLLWGVILWIMALSNYNNNDTVSLWTTSRDIPDMAAFDKALNTLTADTMLQRSKVAITTQASLVDFCVFPSVVGLIKTYIVPATAIPATIIDAPAAAALSVAVSKIDFETWGVTLDSTHTPADASYTTHYLSPLCQCMVWVLSNYTADLTNRADTTSTAFKACFTTQPLPARQVLAFKADEGNTLSRKTMSRHGLLLVLCLAMVLNTAYNAINFDAAENYTVRNGLQFIVIIVSMIAIVTFPVVNSKGATSDNLMKMTSILYIPGIFLEGFGIDYFALSWVYRQKRRTSFLHPFTFYITLVTLGVLALLENGVFTIEAVTSCSFISHAVALVYSAVLFFLHFSCGDWTKQEKPDKPEGGRYLLNQPAFVDLGKAEEQVIKSYLLAILTIFLICWNILIPSFAIKTDPNILWILPVVFICVAFAIPVWVEHLYDSREDRGEKLELTSHWANMGYTFILLTVLLYFTLEWMFLRYGDTTFTQGGQRLKILNFGLSLRPSNPMQYIIP